MILCFIFQSVYVLGNQLVPSSMSIDDVSSSESDEDKMLNFDDIRGKTLTKDDYSDSENSDIEEIDLEEVINLKSCNNISIISVFCLYYFQSKHIYSSGNFPFNQI